MDREAKQKNMKEKVYNFIVDFIKKNGFSPSVREICIGTGLHATSSVYTYLQKLEDEGRIQVKRKSTRAIKVLGYEFVKVEESVCL